MPHPQGDVLNPRARKRWNAPPEEFENPLEYYCLLCRNDVSMIIRLVQLVKQVQSLSSFAPGHPFQSSGHTWIPSLAGAITWFSSLWVGSLVPTPNSLGMGLVCPTQCKIYIDARWSDIAVDCCIFVEWSLTHKAKEVRGYINSASSPPNSRIMPFV